MVSFKLLVFLFSVFYTTDDLVRFDVSDLRTSYRVSGVVSALLHFPQCPKISLGELHTA